MKLSRAQGLVPRLAAFAGLLVGLAAALVPDVDAQEPTRPTTDPVRVFLVGNTGTQDPSELRPTLEGLTLRLGGADARSAVVLLGDLTSWEAEPESTQMNPGPIPRL